MMAPPVPPEAYRFLIQSALEEDIGRGDRTTKALFSQAVPAIGVINAKESLLVAGLWIIPEIFREIDPSVEIQIKAREGEQVPRNTELARCFGDGRSLLQGERVTLNFLQRLCGIASYTAKFVEAVRPFPAKILDTRKTVPGWRRLDKYAVRLGGGENHRNNLEESILIKDNHLLLGGPLKTAIQRAREVASSQEGVEVEVGSLEEVEQVMEIISGHDNDIIMLDNMDLPQIEAAVSLIDRRARIEVSGGVTLSNIRMIAACGVDFISIGALTHSAPASDLNLTIRPTA